jgi:hypothetical protein
MKQETKISRKEIVNRVVMAAIKDDYRKYYALYAIDNPKQCSGLSISAAIVDNAKSFIDRENVNPKKFWFFEILAEIIEEMSIKYLPYHPRRLREKITQRIEGKEIQEVISLPRAGNQNRALEGSEEIEAWTLYLRNSGKNFTNAFIERKVKLVCELTGKKCPSESWFAQRLASKEVQYLTSDGRFGAKGRLGNKHRGYNLIAAPLFAGDAWQIDGTRSNLIPFKMSDGKEVYLYKIAVRDVYSGQCLGVCFGIVENGLSVIDALRMAAMNAGYLPNHIIHDKFPGHNAQEWKLVAERLTKVGVKITTTATATGKAQQERWFGTLQTVFMQGSAYYYGEGIQSRRLYAHRSGEQLKKQKTLAKQQGWDFSTACEEMQKVIEAYNNTPFSEYSRKFKNVTASPRQLHDQSDKPNAIFITHHSITTLQILGYSKELTIKGGGRLETEILGAKFYYNIDDFLIISKYDKVRIAYDLDKLDSVEVFDLDNDRWLCTAKEDKPIQIFGATPQYGELQKSKTRLKNLEILKRETLAAKMTPAEETVVLLEGGAWASKDRLQEAENSFYALTMGDGEPTVMSEEVEEKEVKEVEIDTKKYFREQT